MVSLMSQTLDHMCRYALLLGRCRRHHQLKQHPRWKLRQGQPGDFTWTTPTTTSINYTQRMSQQPGPIDIYARVSRKGDKEQRSTGGQVQVCRSILADRNLPVGEVFV